VRNFVDSGKVKLFTVDSVDNQSWANWGAQPAERARRHQDYDRYITDEVAPFIRRHCGHQDCGSDQADGNLKCLATGVSMGAYHSLNFFFRHPDIFNALIAISGLYQLSMFVGDYSDGNVYFNTPLAYLPNLSDPWYIDQYRQSQIIVCCGQGAWEDAMLADTYTLKQSWKRSISPPGSTSGGTM
jgi:esterase/lipase superfamily enzyme